MNHLEELAWKIIWDLKNFEGGDSLKLGVCPEENTFLVKKRISGGLFGISPTYAAVLLLQEKNEKGLKKIVASPRHEEVEKLVRKYKEQYMKENDDVAYFTIVRGEKIAFGGSGLS